MLNIYGTLHEGIGDHCICWGFVCFFNFLTIIEEEKKFSFHYFFQLGNDSYLSFVCGVKQRDGVWRERHP